MPSIEEKLHNFSQIVLEEAEKLRAEKMSQLEDERRRRVSEQEDKLLEEAYDDIQRSVVESRRVNSERVLKAEMSVKKELIRQREKIIDDVFAEVSQKLAEFTDTDEYKAWLMAHVSEAAAEVGSGTKNIYVTRKDMRFKDEIEAKTDDSSVIADDEDFIGGVRIVNKERNVYVNYAIKDMLAERRTSFLRESGLGIQ